MGTELHSIRAPSHLAEALIALRVVQLFVLSSGLRERNARSSLRTIPIEMRLIYATPIDQRAVGPLQMHHCPPPSLPPTLPPRPPPSLLCPPLHMNEGGGGFLSLCRHAGVASKSSRFLCLSRPESASLLFDDPV